MISFLKDTISVLHFVIVCQKHMDDVFYEVRWSMCVPLDYCSEYKIKMTEELFYRSFKMSSKQR